MVRDTAQRVMLALAIPCLLLAVVRGGLSVAFGWDAPEAGWFGTVAGLLLVAEMVYGWLRKRDNVKARRQVAFPGSTMTHSGYWSATSVAARSEPADN